SIAAKVRHRPDRAAVADLGIDDQTVVTYFDAVADLRIQKPRSRSNDTIRTYNRIAFDRHVRIDDGITANLSLNGNISIPRIDERHTAFLHQFLDSLVVYHSLYGGELLSIVHAFDLDRPVMPKHGNCL